MTQVCWSFVTLFYRSSCFDSHSIHITDGDQNVIECLWDIARDCFSCNALHQPSLHPVFEALLASKFRYHEFFYEKYGPTHITVITFEAVCAENDVNRRTIFKWGKLIHEDVVSRNKNNLAKATGHNQDPGEELVHLKGQVETLQNAVDDGQKEIKKLSNIISQQTALMTKLVDRVEQLGEVHVATATAAVAPMVSPQSLGKKKDKLSNLQSPAEQPPDPPVDDHAEDDEEQDDSDEDGSDEDASDEDGGFVTSMDEFEGKIPLASGQNACKFNSADFLVKLAARGLKIEAMGGDVFYGGEVNPSNKSKFVYVYQYFKGMSSPEKWAAYLKVGAELHKARMKKKNKKKNKELRKKKEAELLVIAKEIVKEGQAAYLKDFVKSDAYLKAKKRAYVYENARSRVLTIGFGGKVGPQKKKRKI